MCASAAHDIVLYIVVPDVSVHLIYAETLTQLVFVSTAELIVYAESITADCFKPFSGKEWLSNFNLLAFGFKLQACFCMPMQVILLPIICNLLYSVSWC